MSYFFLLILCWSVTRTHSWQVLWDSPSYSIINAIHTSWMFQISLLWISHLNSGIKAADLRSDPTWLWGKELPQRWTTDSGEDGLKINERRQRWQPPFHNKHSQQRYFEVSDNKPCYLKSEMRTEILQKRVSNKSLNRASKSWYLERKWKPNGLNGYI